MRKPFVRPRSVFRLAVVALVGVLTISVVASAPTNAAGLTAATATAAVARPGYSMSLVRNTGIGVPRGLAQLSDGSLLVADMGGWEPKTGRVLRLKGPDFTGTPTILFTGVDRPHGIVVGPDKLVYVGEPGRVFRFDPTLVTPTRQYVIGATGSLGAAAGMPIRKTHLHPLAQILFLADGSLLVNLGSDSNNCAADSKRGMCRATTGSSAVGVVRRYRFDKPGGKVVSWSVMASGLRNSMAIVQAASGAVLQVENSRDAIDEADAKLSDERLPHDELNELVSGGSYGWPYCYDNQINSPEFRKYACTSTRKPLALLPAHSAPLGMTYWKGRLVISYHGYRDTGHRLVAFPIDAAGRPSGASTEILGGWAETDDRAPGGPVGVIPAQDGSLLVVDDRNGALLRVTAK